MEKKGSGNHCSLFTIFQRRRCIIAPSHAQGVMFITVEIIEKGCFDSLQRWNSAQIVYLECALIFLGGKKEKKKKKKKS